MKKIVVALGGNAILQAGQRGTASEQRSNVQQAAEQVAQMLLADYQIIMTHGNGPQVGNILLQNELGKASVPAMPLDICGAESQGLIGYMLQQALVNALAQKGLKRQFVTLVTQVIVDPHDAAFHNPSKPIGPFYTAAEAAALMQIQGYVMQEDKARGGWRRVVPSPKPVRTQEQAVIRSLVDSGVVVIAAGGGGVPVVERDGCLQGVEAVIDKDLASQRLANDIDADILLILTDVEAVALHWGTARQQLVTELTVAEARSYQDAGHFQAGSMGPKVEAACRFVESGGEMAIVTSLEKACLALQGHFGTRFVMS